MNGIPCLNKAYVCMYVCMYVCIAYTVQYMYVVGTCSHSSDLEVINIHVLFKLGSCIN